MQPIIIYPQSKEQMKGFELMAKALKIPFDKPTQKAINNTFGEEFKKTVLEAQEAYKNGDRDEFVALNRDLMFIKKA